jgi:hypothetical protein
MTAAYARCSPCPAFRTVENGPQSASKADSGCTDLMSGSWLPRDPALPLLARARGEEQVVSSSVHSGSRSTRHHRRFESPSRAEAHVPALTYRKRSPDREFWQSYQVRRHGRRCRAGTTECRLRFAHYHLSLGFTDFNGVQFELMRHRNAGTSRCAADHHNDNQ